MFATLLQVALGGAVGAVLRYLSVIAGVRLLGPGFPWSTVFVNVAGSFAMGVLVVVLAEKGAMRLAPFLLTGVLGGFTTFSAYSLDALSLFERGQMGLAVAYVTGSVALALTGIVLGVQLARGFSA